MAKATSCNIGLGNSRLPDGCTNIADVAKHLIFVRTVADDGTDNKITFASDDLDQTYFDALTGQADQSKRWYPFTQKALETVKDERGEDTYDTFDSGTKIWLQQGTRRFEAEIPTTTVSALGFFEKARNYKMSVWVVDNNGNLIGSTRGEQGVLYPFRIADQTIMAKNMPKQPKAAQRLKIGFDFDVAENDSEINMVQAGELRYDVSKLRGLYDVDVAFASVGATGWVATIVTPYGTAMNRMPVTGLVAGDFTLVNRATGSTVTITSVTESTTTKGKYTFVIPSTAAAKLKLSCTKTGYDFAALAAYVIETP